MAEVVNNAIITVITQGLSKSLGSPGELKALEALEEEVTNDNVIPRFLSSDIEFFDSFYDNKSSNIGVEIEYIEKKIYFKDITMFINRIKNIARVKGVELLRNNL